MVNPLKDYALMSYIGKHCQQLDYVFKGDDDIIVIPSNLSLLIHNMAKWNHLNGNLEDLHSNMAKMVHGVGCLKVDEHVNRDVKSKYFMPDDLVSIAKYPKYFSGAGYILDAKLILEMNRRKNEIPLCRGYINKVLE